MRFFHPSQGREQRSGPRPWGSATVLQSALCWAGRASPAATCSLQSAEPPRQQHPQSSHVQTPFPARASAPLQEPPLFRNTSPPVGLCPRAPSQGWSSVHPRGWSPGGVTAPRSVPVRMVGIGRVPRGVCTCPWHMLLGKGKVLSMCQVPTVHKPLTAFHPHRPLATSSCPPALAPRRGQRCRAGQQAQPGRHRARAATVLLCIAREGAGTSLGPVLRD